MTVLCGHVFHLRCMKGICDGTDPLAVYQKKCPVCAFDPLSVVDSGGTGGAITSNGTAATGGEDVDAAEEDGEEELQSQPDGEVDMDDVIVMPPPTTAHPESKLNAGVEEGTSQSVSCGAVEPKAEAKATGQARAKGKAVAKAEAVAAAKAKAKAKAVGAAKANAKTEAGGAAGPAKPKRKADDDDGPTANDADADVGSPAADDSGPDALNGDYSRSAILATRKARADADADEEDDMKLAASPKRKGKANAKAAAGEEATTGKPPASAKGKAKAKGKANAKAAAGKTDKTGTTPAFAEASSASAESGEGNPVSSQLALITPEDAAKVCQMMPCNVMTAYVPCANVSLCIHTLGAIP